MRYYRLVVTFVLLALLGNGITFFLFLTSDFWDLPLSAQATSEASLSLFVISNTSSSPGTPSSPGTSAGSSGGQGGGGSAAPVSEVSFVVDPEELNLFFVAGSSEERTFAIANTGRSSITLTLSLSGISSFATIDNSTLVLAPGESKYVTLRIKVPDGGIYGGRIGVSSGAVRKEVILLLNVRSANALFDVSLTLPEPFKVLLSGRTLKTFISLLQVGPAEDTDVTATYIIKDLEGNTLLTETETFRVFKSKSYVKDFATQGLKEGDYLVGVEIVYPQGFATSSAYFAVATHVLDYSIIALVVLLVFSLIILFYSFRTYRRAKQLRISGRLKKRGAP